MTIEATPRANAFAAFQQKLVSAGIRVGSPTMTGLQLAAQQYAATVADEAVAGATLCLTEHDIAHAISQWADEETAQGQMVRAMQLRQAAVTILNAAGQVDEQRAKAVLRLPPAAPELPTWIRDRVDSVLRLVYGEKADAAPIHRLFVTVVHEMVRTATGQAPSDVNAPAPAVTVTVDAVQDATLAEFVACYALALVRYDGRGAHQAEDDACRVTWNIIAYGGDFSASTPLAEMMQQRGFQAGPGAGQSAFSEYLARLADRPDAGSVVRYSPGCRERHAGAAGEGLEPGRLDRGVHHRPGE